MVIAQLEPPHTDTVVPTRLGQLIPMPSRGIDNMAGIAHDMRGPLATISMSAELLEEDLSLDDRSHLLDVIQRQAFRLRQMVADLSDFLKSPNGDVSIKAGEVDMGLLLREAAAEMHEFTKSHVVTLQLPSTDVFARSDAEKVRRIVQNLLTNAVKYSPAGGEVVLRLRAPADDDSDIVIEVEDNGPGVPENMRDRIFEPFVQLSDSAGQGLGLFVVRCLAQAHGGNVWCESGRDGGALFSVSLPAHASALRTLNAS